MAVVMSTSGLLQPRRVVTRKRKGVGISGIETMEMLPPISLQKSAEKPTAK
jgi:hypothetical protein